jgi:YgiT-type zinc finger domain-containing protein
MKLDPRYLCPNCQIGTLKPRRAFFFTLQDGRPICVPDFPAWVCDLCGSRQYDPTALIELRVMLEADRRTRRRRRYLSTRSNPESSRQPIDPHRHR